MMKKITFIWLIIVLLGGNGCEHAAPSKNSHGKPPAPQKYVVHTVRSGETLSEIAMNYYGTYKKYDALDKLKKLNKIDNARVIQPGDKIRIPVLKIEGELRPEISYRPLLSRPAPPAEPVRGYPKTDDVANVKQLLKEKKYPEAIAELEKMLRASPGDRTIRDCLGVAYYHQAVGRYQRKQYRIAREGFETALTYKKDCHKCRQYVRKISDKANSHTREGERLFGGQKYLEAIAQFEKALHLNSRSERIYEHLFAAYFEHAVSRFEAYQQSGNKSDYRAARTALRQSALYQKNCPTCLKRQENYTQEHYNEGIKYFTDEGHMDEAIREWERVQFVDPGYKKVRQNIRQARRILAKLKAMEKK